MKMRSKAVAAAESREKRGDAGERCLVCAWARRQRAVIFAFLTKVAYKFRSSAQTFEKRDHLPAHSTERGPSPRSTNENERTLAGASRRVST